MNLELTENKKRELDDGKNILINELKNEVNELKEKVNQLQNENDFLLTEKGRFDIILKNVKDIMENY